MSSEAMRRLEHDTLEDQMVAPAEALKREKPEDDGRVARAKRSVGLREENEWLSIDNPAIWTPL